MWGIRYCGPLQPRSFTSQRAMAMDSQQDATLRLQLPSSNLVLVISLIFPRTHMAA